MRLFLSAFIAGESAFLFISDFPDLKSLFFQVVTFALLFLLFTLALQRLKFLKVEKTIPVCIALVFFIAGLIWGGYWHLGRLKNTLPESLEGVNLVVEGYVDSMVSQKEDGQRFSFSPIRWRKPQDVFWNQVNVGEFPSRVNLGWYAPRLFGFANQSINENQFNKIPKILPGQMWQLPVKLQKPRGQLNPHAFDFEAWAYMNNFGAVGYVGNKGEAILLPQSKFTFEIWIESIRENLKVKITKAFPNKDPYLGVLIALVIGDQSAINQADWKIFNRSGIGHLISISGLHITMLAGIGFFLGRFFWARFGSQLLMPTQLVSFFAGALVAYSYTWIAGFQIPAQRTTMMLLIFGWSLYRGRLISPFDVWLLALWMVLVINPLAILMPGFWLSFGAVAIILYGMLELNQEFTDVDNYYLSRLRKSILSAARVQLVVTVGLIPLTAWWFSSISIISPIANAIAIPLISFVTTPFAILGAFLPSFIGNWFLEFAHLSVELLMFFLEPMARWQWAVMDVTKPSFWRFLIAMGGVVLTIAPGSLRAYIKWRCIGVVSLFALFIPAFPSIGSGEFRALVWDIGQGSAVLVQTKTKALLFDSGPVGGKSNDPGERILLPYLKAEGINRLDVLAISHKDSDHIGGARSLLAGVDISQVIGSIPRKHFIYQIFDQSSIPMRPCRAGDQWSWDGVKFEVFHPASYASFDEGFHHGKANEISCVIRVSNDSHALWLTGDVEREGEAAIVMRLRRSKEAGTIKNVLMAPHHGSNTSSSLDFLNQISPDWAFSQSGHKNRYGHPHPKVVSRYETRGVSLLDTSKTGAQEWNFAHDGLKIELYREGKRKIWHR